MMWACCLALCTAAGASDWPQWRGPLATGVAPRGNPPITWSESKNIRWKTPLPGRGHSSPIVWADRVYVTSAVPIGKPLSPRYSGRPGAHNNLPVTQKRAFVVMAVDRKTGRIVWRKTVREAIPHEGGHETASLASASPVTDGTLIIAFFGSNGLYCLNTAGEIQWQKDFGKMHSKHGHGEGASPALHGDTLIVNWDHQGDSFIVALNKHTGEQIWRQPRDELTSWSTPIVVEHNGKQQIIVNGTNAIRAYDLATGRVIWSCGGLSANIVASPVSADGYAYAASSYDKKAMVAIRLPGAAGDITHSEHVVWRRRRGTPYVPSLLLYDDALYFLSHYQNVMSRLVAKTGKQPTGPYRLPAVGNIYASPVAASGRIYITDLNGVTLVMTHEQTPRVLAVNRLDDHFSASAAIAGGDFFLRGRRHLYCIAEPSE